MTRTNLARKKKLENEVLDHVCTAKLQRCPHSSALVTLDAESDVWSSAVSIPPTDGAFVRLRPPSDVDEGRLASVREEVAHWASAVRVVPAARAKAVPDAVAAAPVQATGAREAVCQLLAESRSVNPQALSALVERLMGEVGL